SGRRSTHGCCRGSAGPACGRIPSRTRSRSPRGGRPLRPCGDRAARSPHRRRYGCSRPPPAACHLRGRSGSHGRRTGGCVRSTRTGALRGRCRSVLPRRARARARRCESSPGSGQADDGPPSRPGPTQCVAPARERACQRRQQIASLRLGFFRGARNWSAQVQYLRLRAAASTRLLDFVRTEGGMEYDVLVIGSGPGGASVARELARAGRRVLILERGRDWRRHRLYGTYPGALLYADRHALLFTRQGLNVIRPLMVGGATSMYAACASPPGDWWRSEYGIDLRADAATIAQELHVAPLHPELRGTASTQLAEAGASLGMEWTPQDKFMRPERGDAFRCG